MNTQQMVEKWLQNHKGNTESLARWMAYRLRLGSIAQCRSLIAQVLS